MVMSVQREAPCCPELLRLLTSDGLVHSLVNNCMQDPDAVLAKTATHEKKKEKKEDDKCVKKVSKKDDTSAKEAGKKDVKCV